MSAPWWDRRQIEDQASVSQELGPSECYSGAAQARALPLFAGASVSLVKEETIGSDDKQEQRRPPLQRARRRPSGAARAGHPLRDLQSCSDRARKSIAAGGRPLECRMRTPRTARQAATNRVLGNRHPETLFDGHLHFGHR